MKKSKNSEVNMFERLVGSNNKSELEKAIDTNGVEQVASAIAQMVIERIPNQNIAQQFLLEEMEAASQGNEAAMNYVASSGFDPDEYTGAMRNSCPEVDGPNGPQQLLLRACMEISDGDTTVAFRLSLVDTVMAHFELGKYAEIPFELDYDWMNELIEWAQENNLPERTTKETFCGTEYVGFPSEEDSIKFLCGFDNFAKDSFYDLSRALEINLNSSDISYLPESICCLVGIHKLHLHTNNLESLPENIGQLKNLYQLDLGNNSITNLPESIGKLIHLEILNLYGNGLVSLPDSIVKLNNLEQFNIAGNPNLKLTQSQRDWLEMFDEDGYRY